jgi:hypothetical protein
MAHFTHAFLYPNCSHLYLPKARSRRQFLLPPSSSSSQRRCYISRLPLLRADPLSSATARLLFPRVEMAAVNLLAKSAAVRLRAPAPPGAGEELAARLTECGFPATARRGGAVAEAGESARKWREMAARKEKLLLRSRGRVAWTIVALCCGSHASHILHSLGIHVGHGELPRDIHSVI